MTAPLLGTEVRRAVGIGNELRLARKLANCRPKPGYAEAIQRAVTDASEWAHDLCRRYGAAE